MCSSSSAIEKLKATAFHEAGHVIVHEIFGWSYTNALIRSDGGTVNYDYEEITKESPWLDQLIYACICLSGSVAEDKHRACLPPERYGASVWMAKAHIGEEMTDWDKYQSLKLSNPHYRLLQKFVNKLISENWSLIEKIAITLLERKELTFEEIQPMLDGQREQRQLYIQELQAIPKKTESCAEPFTDDLESKDSSIEEVKHLEDFL